MFGHIEYRNVLGDDFVKEAVAVIDPMGYVVIALIIALAIISYMIYKRFKAYNKIIAEQQDLIDFYYNEDQYK